MSYAIKVDEGSGHPSVTPWHSLLAATKVYNRFSRKKLILLLQSGISSILRQAIWLAISCYLFLPGCICPYKKGPMVFRCGLRVCPKLYFHGISKKRQRNPPPIMGHAEIIKERLESFCQNKNGFFEHGVCPIILLGLDRG